MDVIVIKEMTYQEVDGIKSNIAIFLRQIEKIAVQYNFDTMQGDKDFFTFIAKHIVFFKYIYSNAEDKYFYKVLISDFYYFILSIVKNEIRYMYVNERSIIENYLRAIMQVTVEDNHVTDAVFKELRQTHFECDFQDEEYALIKSEYAVSCGYVHGGDILNDNLAYVLCECEHQSYDAKKRNKHYQQLKKMIKVFDRLLIARYALFISGCFHRRKSVMEYLVGKDNVDLLFKIIS